MNKIKQGVKESSERKPRVFIGSSTEGHWDAVTLQRFLRDHGLRVTVWSQGVFGLTQGTLETLVAKCRDFDYAVLVLTPDDVTLERNVENQTPRDNVLFELGLFMAALGRERTFISARKDVKLPTDLAGVTVSRIPVPEDLSTPVETINQRIADLGVCAAEIATQIIIDQAQQPPMDDAAEAARRDLEKCSIDVTLSGIDQSFGTEPLRVIVSKSTTVGKFLDDVYQPISSRVPPRTYGREWVLRDIDSSKSYTAMGALWAEDTLRKTDDDRNLREVINETRRLLAVRLTSTP